jgi:hypothetical protein
MVQGFTYWDNLNYPELDIKDFENEQDFRDTNSKAIDEIVDYCIEHKIYVSDYKHQSLDFHGVPVVDGHAITFSLRMWSSVMADVWSKITGNNYNYLDFYCENQYSGSIDGILYNEPSTLLN